jgi:hypothetical protein
MIVLLAVAAARAQDLEPRAYVNTPVGMNFLIAGYAYSEGGVSTDPSVPIQDAQLQLNTFVLAYVRSLDVFGKSGKIDVIVPVSQLSGSASVEGQTVKREVAGFGDTRLLFSVNLVGWHGSTAGAADYDQSRSMKSLFNASKLREVRDLRDRPARSHFLN